MNKLTVVKSAQYLAAEPERQKRRRKVKHRHFSGFVRFSGDLSFMRPPSSMIGTAELRNLSIM